MDELKLQLICLALALSVLVCTTAGQSWPEPTTIPNCESVYEPKPPSRRMMVHLGVVNGKALTLVTPKYPQAARDMGIHGTVLIQVLIDPRGCVAEAKAVSGNPVFIAESLSAAKGSVFVPTLLSGTPVWIYGTIEYRYVPTSLNWLELGYYASDPEKLLLYLPDGFETERDQLKLAIQDTTESRTSSIADIRSTTLAKLSTDEKSHFLFSLGSLLRELEGYGQKEEVIRGKLNQLQNKIDTAPPKVSKDLMRTILNLVRLREPDEIRKSVQQIADRFYIFGK